VGSPLATALPEPSAPRNPGQSSLASAATAKTPQNTTARININEMLLNRSEFVLMLKSPLIFFFQFTKHNLKRRFS